MVIFHHTLEGFVAYLVESDDKLVTRVSEGPNTIGWRLDSDVADWLDERFTDWNEESFEVHPVRVKLILQRPEHCVEFQVKWG